jgi:hypothetical protein
MGRPINQKYFKSLIGANAPKTAVLDQYISGVVVATSGTIYSQGITLVIAQPEDPNGVQATATANVNTTTGWISSVTMTNTGSGYMTVPAVSIVKPANQTATVTTNTTNTLTLNGVNGIYVGMKVVGNGISTLTTYVSTINAITNVVGLTQNNASSNLTGAVITFSDVGVNGALTASLHAPSAGRSGALHIFAFLPNGTGVSTANIWKQEGSRSYLVENNDGTGRCKLVSTSTLTAGQMNLVATDANGSTYYVKKLTAYRASLVQSTMTRSFLFSNGSVARWTTATVVTTASNQVSLAHY